MLLFTSLIRKVKWIWFYTEVKLRFSSTAYLNALHKFGFILDYSD